MSLLEESLFKFESELKDCQKRLYAIENSLLQMIDVIDMAQNYNDRLKKLERLKQPKGSQDMLNENIAEVPNPQKISPQEIQGIKVALIEKAYRHYGELISYLKGLPVNQSSLIYAFINLDQGMHWVEKIIQGSQFSMSPEPLTPVNENQNTISKNIKNEVEENEKNDNMTPPCKL